MFFQQIVRKMKIRSFERFFAEDNVAGGIDSVFGSINAGSTGGMFPASGDAGYAPGDARVPVGMWRGSGRKRWQSRLSSSKLQNAKLQQAKRKKLRTRNSKTPH